MTLSSTFTLSWDLNALAEALQISQSDTETYFRDGRRISFILERRFRDLNENWRLAPSEGAGYDLVDQAETKWEVRSISKNIYFCPSYMVGSGRKFEKDGFLRKLKAIGGYICADITKFPTVPIFVVPTALIRRLYDAGKLGTSTSISRDRFYALIVPELNAIKLSEGAKSLSPS